MHAFGSLRGVASSFSFSYLKVSALRTNLEAKRFEFESDAKYGLQPQILSVHSSVLKRCRQMHHPIIAVGKPRYSDVGMSRLRPGYECSLVLCFVDKRFEFVVLC